MKKMDVVDCEFDNPENCYHLTRGVHEEKIARDGLGADIGIRSRDGMGNEKTSKVFFAKTIEGALIFLNRNLNIFYSLAKNNNFETCKKALIDDRPELYEQIFENMVHDKMSQEELEQVAIALGKLYLERGIYYKLDLKHSTREEFENMTPKKQDEIDYFSDDINEERPDEQPMINNMHTRAGRGVKVDKMTLMTTGEKKSALDIVVKMSEFYKSLNPEKTLPVLEYKNGSKDRPLLEMLVDKMKEKSTQELGEETLTEQKDVDTKDEMSNKLLSRSKQIQEIKEGKSQGG